MEQCTCVLFIAENYIKAERNCLNILKAPFTFGALESYPSLFLGQYLHLRLAFRYLEDKCFTCDVGLTSGGVDIFNLQMIPSKVKKNSIVLSAELMNRGV